MPNPFDPSEDEQFFLKRYGEAQSETARRVEMEAFGHDVGVNGYTTVAGAHAVSPSEDPGGMHRRPEWHIHIGQGPSGSISAIMLLYQFPHGLAAWDNPVACGRPFVL